MECLEGIVGIYCPDATPVTSGNEPMFYLSELPGINLAKAALSTDQETVTGVTLMMKALNFSQKIVPSDFIQRLRKEQLFIAVVGQDTIGRHGDSFLLLVDQYTGYRFSMVDPTDRFIYGELEYVEMKVETAATGASIFYQIDNQDPVEIQRDFIQGYNKIFINAQFNDSLRIWINQNQLALSDGQTGLTGSTNRSCVTHCEEYCAGCVTWRSITGNTVDPLNVTWTEGGEFNGIVAMVVCKSKPEELICMFRNDLAPALLYRAGAYMMEEHSASSRNSPEIRNTKDEAALLYARWMGGSDPQTGFTIKGEYPRLLQQVVESAIALVKTTHSKAFVSTGLRMGYGVTSSRRIRGQFRNTKK